MAPWGVSHKDLAHGGLSLSGKDYMKSSLIGGPSGEIVGSLRMGGGGGGGGGALWGGCILAQWGLPSGGDSIQALPTGVSALSGGRFPI